MMFKYHVSNKLHFWKTEGLKDQTGPEGKRRHCLWAQHHFLSASWGHVPQRRIDLPPAWWHHLRVKPRLQLDPFPLEIRLSLSQTLERPLVFDCQKCSSFPGSRPSDEQIKDRLQESADTSDTGNLTGMLAHSEWETEPDLAGSGFFQTADGKTPTELPGFLQGPHVRIQSQNLLADVAVCESCVCVEEENNKKRFEKGWRSRKMIKGIYVKPEECRRFQKYDCWSITVRT